MTTAMTVLTTLQDYPSLGYMAACILGIGIGALLAAAVAYYVRP